MADKQRRKPSYAVITTMLVVCLLGSASSKPYGRELEYPDDTDRKPDEEILQDALKNLPKNGELFEGDIVMDNRLRRAVYGEQSKKSFMTDSIRWPGAIIPYEIDEKFPKNQRKLLAEAISEYHNRTCIVLRPRNPLTDENYVVFTNQSNECSSAIGMIGGEQKVTLGPHCGVLGTYEHEIMHALGFIHEHSRPDRDDYLDVRFENIKKDGAANFMRYTMDEVDTSTVFDFASIMLYRNNAFTKNGKDTLQATAKRDLNFGQRLKFSCQDVKEINLRYQENERCQHFLEHPNCHGLYQAYHTKRIPNKKKRRDGRGESRSLASKLLQGLSIFGLFGDG